MNPASLSRDRANGLRARLPPPVPKPNPQGKKTHGWWIDDAGREHPITSGRDDDSAAVWELMRKAGVPTPFEPITTTHVEMKLVARMVREGRRHLDVVINNVLCPGRFGCDSLAPVLLPDGYALTVHGPGYRKTLTGGVKPSWR